MSSNIPEYIDKGEFVLHHNELKKIKDFYFTSDGTHNGDILVLEFTDHTSTKNEDLRYVKELDKQNKDYLIDLYKTQQAQKRDEKKMKIRKDYIAFLGELRSNNRSYEDVARMLFELKHKVKVE